MLFELLEFDFVEFFFSCPGALILGLPQLTCFFVLLFELLKLLLMLQFVDFLVLALQPENFFFSGVGGLG